MRLGFQTNNPHNQWSSRQRLPKDLQHLLSRTKQQHYEELYEDGAGQEPLENALKDVLDSFDSLDHSMCHSRYVWMAILLGFAVKPTVEAHLQRDNRPKIVIILTLTQLEKAYLSSNKKRILKQLKSSFEDNLPISTVEKISEGIALINSRNDSKDFEVSKQKACLSRLTNKLFPKLSEGCQALDEGLDVFRNVLRTLDQQQSQTALLNLLDECFEGYAIFPGSAGRRELFNWWLDEIIPATWNFQTPRYFHTIKGTQTLEAILEGLSWEEKDSTFLLECLDRSDQG